MRENESVELNWQTANLRAVDRLLAPLSGCILSFNERLECTFAGEGFEGLFKRAKHEITGKSMGDFFGEISPEETELTDKLRAVLAYDSSFRKNISYTLADVGKSGFFDLSCQPLVDLSGRHVGGVCVLIDSTPQAEIELRLRETEARFKNMADSSPVLLWMSGTDGLCNFFNQTWLDFTGRDVDEEWGLGWSEAVHPEDFQRCMDVYVRNFRQRQAFEMEYRLRRKDGEYRWILDRGTPRYLQDKSFAGFIGSCIDITDRKIAEQELRLAKEAADAANQAKTNFLATISHEIRTPLSIVLGFSELVLSPDQSPSDLMNYVSGIRRNGQLVVSIINSILDLSKIEAGKFEVNKDRVRLRDLVDEVSDIIALQADEKGLLFSVDVKKNVPDYIETDPTRLKQILVNIVGNAIKFTERGEIEVQVSMEAQGDADMISIVVRDSGRGLTEDQVRRLFQPFTQADSSTTRQFGGTGLGLSLAKRLAKALGGDVTLVRSELGSGSTFKVTVNAGAHGLDSVAEGQPEAETHDQDPISLANTRILLVDDSRDNQMLFGRYLIRAGANVEYASNGSEAISRMKSNLPFDVVLMDISMPVMDGHEATRNLRKQGIKTPIIALTAHALREERDRCFASGFDEHLSKPISRESILRAVSRFINAPKGA